MNILKFYLSLLTGKFVAFIINIIDKSRGTNKSGEIACKICKNFISNFKNINLDNIIIVTGTNGKSTTINMISSTLKHAGKSIATNIEGANLMTGIATTLIKNSTLFGKFNKEILLLEVDERSLPAIHKLLPAKKICITNIQKDQVQRNGDPDYIYQIIKKVINKDVTLYLNNEEPRTKSFEDLAGKVIYYGIEKNEKSFIKNDFYDVTLPCPKCNSKIEFDYYNIDNIGNFNCTGCNFKSQDTGDFIAENINYNEGTFEVDSRKYISKYTEPFFIYNFVLCIAICKEFEIEEDTIEKAIKSFKNIEGRIETLIYKTKTIKYIRIKQENPETLQTAFNYISQDKTPKILMFGPEELKDFKPYYTNTFYTFDCDLNNLIESDIEHYICFSEIVAIDAANRLIYAGIPKEKISILKTDDDKEIMNELDKYNIDNVYLITWLKKYHELDNYIKTSKGIDENE